MRTVSRSPGSVEVDRALAARPARVQVDEPDRLLRRAAARARRSRSRTTATSAPSRAARPAAIAAAVSAETAPCSRSTSSGTPSAAAFTSFAYETMPPTKTSLEPGTEVSRAATSPPVHDSAVASVRPRSRHSVEHDLLDRRLASRVKRYSASGATKAPLELVRARLGARLDEEIDVDLEVARADRHLHPVAVAARRRERLRRRADSPTP